MKTRKKIFLIISFFVVLGGLIGVSMIKTSAPTAETVTKSKIISKNSETSTENPTERPTRKPEKPTEKTTSAFTQKKLKNVEKKITDRLDTMNFNGTFLVAVGDEIIYHKAMGYSDIEKKRKNTLETKYEIGSCSKQFTATAIARLAQQKKLSLTDSVTKYVKDAKISKDIKIEHLMNMCSGLPDYLNEYIYALESEERDEDTDFSKREFIEWLNEREVNFEPGEYFAYSNTNYYLLGLIIEEVSGKRYEDYIKDEIFYPLYMDNSSLIMTDTTGKGYLDSEWTEGIKVDSSYFYSAGEIVSTTSDMLKWINAYSRGYILNSDTLKKATHAGNDGFNYGYGWFVTDYYYYHTGNTELYYAIDIVTRENDIKIVGLSNVNDRTLQQVGLTIMTDVQKELFPKSENKSEKTTEKATQKATEKTTEKATQKMTEETTQKATQKND